MLESKIDTRVCFVGDSFVAGQGDSSGLGWVGRVVVAGLARGLLLTAYNLGVRRETSIEVARRVPVEIGPRLAPADDARVVCSFGANDTVWERGRPRVPTSETLQALRDVSHAVVSGGLLFVGPPAVADSAQNDRLKLVDIELKLEADRLGVAFLSTFDATLRSAVWRRQVREGDGYHPDAEGYSVLAEVVVEPLLDWFVTPRAC